MKSHWLTRTVLLVVGFLSLGLGIVGAFLPLLPTTPFVLLAAACFAKSSPKFQAWLLSHKTFGPAIRNWREKGALSLKTKIVATISIAISFAVTWHTVELPVARIGAGAVLLGVTLFILSRPRG